MTATDWTEEAKRLLYTNIKPGEPFFAILAAALAAAEARGAEAKAPKTFPIANADGWRGTIPFYIAERAYLKYSEKYGRSQSLERLGERGGFHETELDAFVPGWRDEIGELAQLRAERDQLKRGYDAVGLEAWPCPGCKYDKGKFISKCSLHQRIDAAVVQGLEMALVLATIELHNYVIAIPGVRSAIQAEIDKRIDP